MHPFWSIIRTVPNFPKTGISFFDLTPLLLDHVSAVTDAMIAAVPPDVLDEVETFVAIEARGFVFASLLTGRLGKGVILLRKSGKLPPPVHGYDYALEYGNDRLEMHADLPPRKVLLVDDVLATGGTLTAAAGLSKAGGHTVLGSLVLLDLEGLHGELAWPSYRVLTA